jgi:hypothetical protein
MTTNTISTDKKRRGCLTAFLVFLIVANPLAGIFYIVGAASVKQSIPSLPDWGPIILGILTFSDFVFALAMWQWKKWGVYGYVSTSVVSAVINYIGMGFWGALMGILGIPIVLLLLRPVWNQMK